MNDDKKILATKSPETMLIFKEKELVYMQKAQGTPSRIARFDLAIYEAICSIYNDGKPGFTELMIWRTITGRNMRRALYKATRQTIKESIERLNGTAPQPTPADMKRAADPEYFPTYKSKYFSYRRPLLKTEYKPGPVVMYNKAETMIWYFTAPPELLRKSNFFTIPATWLNTNIQQFTPDIFAIRSFLFNLICEAKQEATEGTPEPVKIECLQLFKILNVANKVSVRCKRKRVYDKLLDILQDFQTKDIILKYEIDDQQKKIINQNITLFFIGNQKNETGTKEGTADNER